jgi:copper(I)-binding protein
VLASQHIHLVLPLLNITGESGMKQILVLLALVMGSMLAVSAKAQTTAPPPTIAIETPFARATAATAKTASAYLTIVNTGLGDDRLVAASTPVAAEIGPHRMIDDNGVMRMRPLDSVEVKAGGRTELKPGGIHLMLTGLKAPLKEGQNFPLTLTFEKAGVIAITVPVGKAGAMSGHDMKGMKM